MKNIFAALLIYLSFVVSVNAQDIIISSQEQARRDYSKEEILKAELDNEKAAIAKKKELMIIADTINDTASLKSLNEEIEQHTVNVVLLEKEMGLKSAQARPKASQSPKPITEADSSFPAQAGVTPRGEPWWDTYNRPSKNSNFPAQAGVNLH